MFPGELLHIHCSVLCDHAANKDVDCHAREVVRISIGPIGHVVRSLPHKSFCGEEVLLKLKEK